MIAAARRRLARPCLADRDGTTLHVVTQGTAIGVSGDSVESHQGFAAKHDLPFLLVSDADGSLRKAYGVKKSLGFLEGRVTYVIDPEGVVREQFSSQLRAKEHQARALKAIQAGQASAAG